MSPVASVSKPSVKGKQPLPAEWKTGLHGIPVTRYTHREFARLEAELFWPKVWQMACRIDQIPSPGSYTVYDILNESIVVVRADENTVKAYHNVCPHRATALALGSGRFQLGQIICPFHGWKWNLQGENTYVPERQEFKGSCLSDQEIHLREVHVEVWAGFVYINLDKNPTPFEQNIAPIQDIVDGVKLGDMKFHWHISTRVNANWKVAQEAFIEAYHVPQTHPQLIGGRTPEVANSIWTYEPMANGHGLFHSAGASSMGRLPKTLLEAMSQEEQTDTLLRSLSNMYVGHDSMVHAEEVDIARTMRRRKLPEGVTVGQEFQKVIREHYAAQARPIGEFEALARCTDMHIFPHITFLPSFGNAVMYRARPTKDNDPDWCIFDMYSIRTYPEGQTPPKWETRNVEGDLKDPKNWYLIPSQDFTSVTRQQQGMHSMAIRTTLMAEKQESLIVNMHCELDKYLEAT